MHTGFCPSKPMPSAGHVDPNHAGRLHNGGGLVSKGNYEGLKKTQKTEKGRKNGC